MSELTHTSQDENLDDSNGIRASLAEAVAHKKEHVNWLETEFLSATHEYSYQSIYDLFYWIEKHLDEVKGSKKIPLIDAFLTDYISVFMTRMRDETDINDELENYLTPELLIELEIMGKPLNEGLPHRTILHKRKKSLWARLRNRHEDVNPMLGSYAPSKDTIQINAEEEVNPVFSVAKTNVTGFNGRGMVLYHELLHRQQNAFRRKIVGLLRGVFPELTYLFLSFTYEAARIPPELLLVTLTSCFLQLSLLLSDARTKRILGEVQANYADLQLHLGNEESRFVSLNKEEEMVTEILIEDYGFDRPREKEKVQVAVEKIRHLKALGYSQAEVAQAIERSRWHSRKKTFVFLDRLINQAKHRFDYTEAELEALQLKMSLDRKARILQTRIIAYHVLFTTAQKHFPEIFNIEQTDEATQASVNRG